MNQVLTAIWWSSGWDGCRWCDKCNSHLHEQEKNMPRDKQFHLSCANELELIPQVTWRNSNQYFTSHYLLLKTSFFSHLLTCTVASYQLTSLHRLAWCKWKYLSSRAEDVQSFFGHILLNSFSRETVSELKGEANQFNLVWIKCFTHHKDEKPWETQTRCRVQNTSQDTSHTCDNACLPYRSTRLHNTSPQQVHGHCLSASNIKAK